jgi:hypothetical protein
MSEFIEIIPDDATFEWSPIQDEGSGRRWDSRFTLRKMPQAERRALARKHTSHKFIRGQRQEILDTQAFADEALDAVIVDWSDLYMRSNGVRQPWPCTTSNKQQLPETIKGDIARMCLGVSFDDAFDGAGTDPLAASTTTSNG